MVQNARMVPQNAMMASSSRQEGKLRISKHFRPISYLQANADQLAEELAAGSGGIVITKDGVPSFVCVSFKDYCQSQGDTGALVDLLALGEREIEAGNYMELSEARSILDERIQRKRSKAKPED